VNRLKTNEIIHGNCLDVLRTIPDESVDSVITDPPYGVSFQSCRKEESERHAVIKNDNAPFIWFLADAFRVLKNPGCLFCFCRWDVQETFRIAIECAGFKVQSQVVWDRGLHGLGDLKRQFAPRHDVAWFATKGDYQFPNGRPMSVITGMRPTGQTEHPTQKPLELMREIVTTTTADGGIVLDPFSGSGSTCVAAKQTGRQFVGIEIDDTYHANSTRRIDTEGGQVTLF
jgi:site-specific DNA-methyltransferase (adenine-specific)